MSPSPPPALSEDQALYLFCLTRRSAASFEHDGLSGRAVRRLPVAEGLSAVVDAVDRAAWTGPQAEENMRSLGWVGPRATRHENVVERAMEEGPVYPARFGTLYSSLERLRTTVTAHVETLTAFLTRVETADEWAVKGLLDRDQATAHLVEQTSAPEAEDEETGTAYLKRRKKEKEARRSVDEWLGEVTQTMKDTLMETASEIRTLDPQRTVKDDTDRSMAFNWAFLVDQDRCDALRQAVRRANGRHEPAGLTLRLTGPWPPYNFRPNLADEPSGGPESDGL